MSEHVIPNCSRYVGPESKTYKVDIDNDGRPDVMTVHPAVSELEEEINCDLINSGEFCLSWSQSSYKALSQSSYEDFRDLCRDRNGTIRRPLQQEDIDLSVFLLEENRLPSSMPSWSVKFATGGVWSAESVLYDTCEGEMDLGFCKKMSEYPPEMSMQRLIINLLGSKWVTVWQTSGAVIHNSSGETLKEGDTVRLLNDDGKDFDTNSILRAGDATGDIYPALHSEWNAGAPWVIKAYQFLGFTSDSKGMDEKDVTRQPDETHRYPIVRAIIRSTEPLNYIYPESVRYLSFNRCSIPREPIYRYKRVSPDLLSLNDVPSAPPEKAIQELSVCITFGPSGSDKADSNSRESEKLFEGAFDTLEDFNQ